MNIKFITAKIINSIIFIFCCNPTCAEETIGNKDYIKFNEDLIFSKHKNPINLEAFEKNQITTGMHYLDIYVNNYKIGAFDIDIQNLDSKITPCLSRELLLSIGLKNEKLIIINNKLNDSSLCLDIQSVLQGAELKINSNNQNIYFSIPQIYMDKNPRGFISPNLLSNGINAGFLNYNLSTYRSDFKNNNTKSIFLNVNSGLNLWGWFLRNNGSYIDYKDNYNSHHSYNDISTYLLKDISSLSSKLIIGQSNTSGRVFDSINFTGLSLSSDDVMLPESLRGFAPVVRGFAQTNARVTVKQKNTIVYETTVPPGEFVIQDLPPTSYGGDLDVTVRESTGFESSFIIPFASIVNMLRPKASKYELIAGKYRRESIRDNPSFYQLTYQRGLSNLITMYGGSQQSEHYGSYLMGAAFNTPFGAVALDVNHSDTQSLNNTLSGQSYRLSFNKYLNKTNSNIRIAAYKLSTEDYLSFDNAMLYQDQLKNGYTPNFNHFLRPKNRYTLNLNQKFGTDLGQLYIFGFYENYWHNSKNGKQIQLGYSNSWNKLFYSFNMSRYSNSLTQSDYSYMLTLNTTLGKNNKKSIASTLGNTADGDWYKQLTVSGSAGKDDRLAWAVTMNKSEGDRLNSTLSTNYTNPFSILTGSSSIYGTNSTISAGISGAIVAHQHGLTFSPYSSNGYIIAHAKDAKGAQISSSPNLKIDFLGNAAIPIGSPYQKNTISLDPKNISENIQLKTTSKDVYPRSGAIILAEFNTKFGYPLLLKPLQNSQIAFGSNVYDENMNLEGHVGQGGLIFIHPSHAKGTLRIFNHLDQESTCTIKYDIQDLIKAKALTSLYTSNYLCKSY